MHCNPSRADRKPPHGLASMGAAATPRSPRQTSLPSRLPEQREAGRPEPREMSVEGREQQSNEGGRSRRRSHAYVRVHETTQPEPSRLASFSSFPPLRTRGEPASAEARSLVYLPTWTGETVRWFWRSALCVCVTPERTRRPARMTRFPRAASVCLARASSPLVAGRSSSGPGRASAGLTFRGRRIGAWVGRWAANVLGQVPAPRPAVTGGSRKGIMRCRGQLTKVFIPARARALSSAARRRVG